MNGFEPGLEILPALTLLRRLGAGGMGEAWLAWDGERGGQVVAKLLPAGAPPERVALLRREARLVRKLHHPRIVPVYGFREGERASVVTLRYLPGGDAARKRRAPVREVVALGRDVADALAYLHEVGVVHRDVKLSNVLLDAEGRAQLADFGIASLARGEEDDVVVRGGGSRASMSPQQLAGEAAQPSDDLYALGVLLHELLAGEAPAPTYSALAATPSLPPGVPTRMRALVASLLEPLPARRPASAAVVREELDQVSAELDRRAPDERAHEERPAVRLQPPPRAADVVSPRAVAAPAAFVGSSEQREGTLAPWQLSLVLALLALAGVSVLWLPRWASAPAPAVATPTPLPSPTAPVAAAEGRRTLEAVPSAPRAATSATLAERPRARPMARPSIAAPAAHAAPALLAPADPAPTAEPTPDRQAEALALSDHRKRADAFEAREEWRSALAEYEAALGIDARVSFALEGRERALRRAELDEALAFHARREDRLGAPAVAREAEQLLERARAVQPAGSALVARIAALEAALARAQVKIAVVIESDGLTELRLSRVGRLGALTRRSLELVPGTYTLTGSRRGYRDVRRQFTVKAGAPPPAVALRCEEAL